VQYERDEREASTPVLARVDELRYLVAQLVGRLVANQAARALEDAAFAQRIDLRFDFLDTTPEARRESRFVEDRIGIAVKEHEDIPRQKGPDVALNELRDRWA
jgi:hypothetical protein